MEGGVGGDAFDDLHLGIMFIFVYVKIVSFVTIVNKEENTINKTSLPPFPAP